MGALRHVTGHTFTWSKHSSPHHNHPEQLGDVSGSCLVLLRTRQRSHQTSAGAVTSSVDQARADVDHRDSRKRPPPEERDLALRNKTLSTSLNRPHVPGPGAFTKSSCPQGCLHLVTLLFLATLSCLLEMIAELLKAMPCGLFDVIMEISGSPVVLGYVISSSGLSGPSFCTMLAWEVGGHVSVFCGLWFCLSFFLAETCRWHATLGIWEDKIMETSLKSNWCNSCFFQFFF